MANVMFKRGLHDNLPKGNKIIDGSFYLTTDTNRLYIGQGNNLVELNKSITVVDVVENSTRYPSNEYTALPTSGVEVGQFYYIKGPDVDKGKGTENGNILAVCTGFNADDTPKWVQINPDTNTDTGYEYLDGMDISAGTVETTTGDKKRIKYTITLHRKHTGVNGDEESTKTLSDITQEFYIDEDNVTGLLTATNITVTSTAVTNDSTTITVSDTATDTSGSFTLTGSGDIKLSGGGNGNNITINSEPYSLESPADNSNAKISLTQEGSLPQNVFFKAGTDLTVSGATNGEISYSHKTYTAPSTTTATTESFISGNSHTFTVVDGITTSNGHVTGIVKKDIAVKDTTYQANTITADSNGRLSFSIIDNDDNSSTSQESARVLYNKITTYDANGNATTDTVYNQGHLGDFYTKTAIDTKIAGLNAMTYKGTVGEGGDVSSLKTNNVTAADNIKVGDTYMVKTDGTLPNTNSKVGDLYIATGNETDGVIIGNVTWELVPAGNDIDTHYSFSVSEQENTNNIIVQAVPDTGAGNVTINRFTGNDPIQVSLSDTDLITISHANSTSEVISAAGTIKGNNSSVTATLKYGDKFKVPAITVDSKGHVTGLTEKEIQLPDTDNTTYTLSATKENEETRITLTPSTGTPTNAFVKGDSVSISTDVSNSELIIKHKDLLISGTSNTAYGVSSTATPVAKTGIITVPNIKVNAQGHVTEISNQEITLPPDTFFELLDPTVTASTTKNGNIDINTGTITFTLTNSENNDVQDNSILKINSSSLKIAQDTASNAMKINIEWDEF